VYGAVDAEDVGVEVVCPRSTAIVAEVAFVLFAAPCSLYAYTLAVEQVAVDPIPRREVSKLPYARFAVLQFDRTLTGRATL
jgi:hypothetical protein